MPRPITWLIGMKLRLIAELVGASQALLLRRQNLATALCRYIAPLGAPVLPEV